MSKTVHVVDGEASESESEIELGKSPDQDISGAEAFIIQGEAPESDDESNKASPALEANATIPSASPAPKYPMKHQYSSLLHHKLWECNVSLRASLDGLLRHTTELAVDKLARSDKTLLNVQESMRATNTNLTLARDRLKQINISLERANCTAAFPTVKIK